MTRLDLLPNGYKIFQDPAAFCFGADARLLCAFSKIKKGQSVIDLGTGNGIIPLLLHKKSLALRSSHAAGPCRFVGLEIQEEFSEKDDGIVIGSKFKNRFNVAVDSEFNEEETIKKFMNASLKFAKKTHLINDELLEIVHKLHGKVLGSSMAMLGNTIFAIANEDQKLKLEAKYYNEFEFYKMDTEGIRIMSHD